MKRSLALSVGALFAIAGSGCSNFLNRFTVNSTAPVLKAGSVAIDSESDVQLARDAAPASLKTAEVFLAVHPEQRDLLELVAQGYSQYTFGFLEDDLEVMGDADSPKRKALVDRATDFYDRSHRIALRLVALDDDKFGAAMKGDSAALDKALKKLDADSAPGLYWAAFAMGSAINLHRDDVDRIADVPKVKAMLERSHELNPNYFNHGAALTLAVVYSAQGKAMGGNPERSKQLFEEVIKATDGKYLMARVMLARFYATVTQDRKLFEDTLKQVLDTPASIWPEQRLANELAKRRAARYLKQADDYF